ncbi:hypothetical protein GOP47_0003819 [Adiantum capillus-veneris]|uniref:Uncharacterized protein n=1 Tax=Adiantum capillus-veneris TaxID=13818 RepID=A0A9D4ZP58_ADICA|nr:hypothetical protein GOP47_0003819 [Adiantum capillus-veneris]
MVARLLVMLLMSMMLVLHGAVALTRDEAARGEVKGLVDNRKLTQQAGSRDAMMATEDAAAGDYAPEHNQNRLFSSPPPSSSSPFRRIRRFASSPPPQLP